MASTAGSRSIQLLLSIVLLSASAGAATPEHEWSQNFGGPGSDTGWTVAVDDLGNVFVTGAFTGTVDFGGGNLVSAGVWDVFLAKYDADGVHQWSRRFGGPADDEGWGLAVDTSGSVFMAGHFQETANFGGADLVSAGASDVFLTSFDASGGHRWSRSFGGLSDDWGWALAVDDEGNVVVTGSFQGTTDFGGGNLVSAGESDIYLVKYDADGVHQWSRRFGGAAWDEGFSVATDDAGDVIVTGYFYGQADFGGGNLVDVGNGDVFLASFDTDGGHQWSQSFGDDSFDRGIKVAADAAGSVSVIGYFYDTNNLGGSDLASAGLADVFVARYDVDGAHQWSRSFGGTDFDLGWALAVDDSGRMVTTGSFYDTANFGGDDLVSAGANDVFVAMYDGDGAHLWSERFGGPSNDEAYGVAVDAAGNIALTGYFFDSVDFGGGELVSAGADDVFLVQFSAPIVTAAPVAPAAVRLAQNFPNPFNPATSIAFTLPRDLHVELTVHDLRGRLVRTVSSARMIAGVHEIRFDGNGDDGRRLASGTYVYRLMAGAELVARKLTMVK